MRKFSIGPNGTASGVRCTMTPEQHTITEIRSPVGFTVRCACGWSFRLSKQNALARAAKIRGAINQHRKDVGWTKAS